MGFFTSNPMEEDSQACDLLRKCPRRNWQGRERGRNES
jgi:hypothetical protein